MYLSSHAIEIPASQIRQISSIAQEMPHVYPLYFGESDIPTPDFIKNAAVEGLDKNYTFYTHNAGYRELREAIAEHVYDRYKVTFDPGSEIAVTAGGVMGIFLAVFASLSSGDHAIIITPSWPNLASIVRMVGGIPVEIPLREGPTSYWLDIDKIERAMDKRTKLFIFNSPSNPLGWIANGDELRAIVEMCEKWGVNILADEVYSRIYYGEGRPRSMIEIVQKKDQLILINSFSKTYCMTGWRVGYVLGGPALIEQIVKLQEFTVSHATSFAQRAAIVAIRDGEGFVNQMVRDLKKRRDKAFDALSQIQGLEVKRPEGAFYLFPRVKGLENSFSFAKSLLLKKHVGVGPGSAFGPGGEGHIRLCFALKETTIMEAVERIKEFVEEEEQVVN